MISRDLPTLTFARTRFTTGEALTQTHRLELLHRLVTDHDGDGGPLRMRVAACVLLLYAQPVTRIMTITVEESSPTTTARCSSGSATHPRQPRTVRHARPTT